jgi:hypothetical protein
MRGSIRGGRRARGGSRSEYGYVRDPETGKTKRVQKFYTFHGTKRQTLQKQADVGLLCTGGVDDGIQVRPVQVVRPGVLLSGFRCGFSDFASGWCSPVLASVEELVDI